MQTKAERAAAQAIFAAVKQSDEPIDFISRAMGSLSALLRDSCGPKFTADLLRAMATKMDVRQ